MRFGRVMAFGLGTEAAVLGVLWLSVCSLLGLVMGGGEKNCWAGIAAIIGLVVGFSLLFSKDALNITTWHGGHQAAFWIGLGISVFISICVAIAGQQQ